MSLPRTGWFGAYGGCFAPEVLVPAVDELRRAYAQARRDPAFRAELEAALKNYAGRPTPLDFAARLTAAWAAPRVFLKREDLMHTGSHKLNNCLGQILLARRMGKRRIIAETGAGQHGVAAATVCARYGSPAAFTWAPRTCGARRSTCTACGSWAPRSKVWIQAPARSKTP
jgi:tryptophan synthase beta chain